MQVRTTSCITFFSLERKARGNSTRRWRCSSYFKEEIFSMEMESAVWSLPAKELMLRPDAGVDAKLKYFEKRKFL